MGFSLTVGSCRSAVEAANTCWGLCLPGLQFQGNGSSESAPVRHKACRVPYVCMASESFVAHLLGKAIRTQVTGSQTPVDLES